MNGHTTIYRTIADVAYCIVEKYPDDVDMDGIQGAIAHCCKNRDISIRYDLSIEHLRCLNEFSHWFIVFRNITFNYTRNVNLRYFPRTRCYEINRHIDSYFTYDDIAYGIVVRYYGDEQPPQ